MMMLVNLNIVSASPSVNRSIVFRYESGIFATAIPKNYTENHDLQNVCLQRLTLRYFRETYSAGKPDHECALAAARGALASAGSVNPTPA